MGQIITPDKSIVNVNGAIQLDGDSASPGNSKLYGTNVSGDRGWYDQPTGSASYPYGLGTSLAADADHDVTIAAGAIPSSDGSTLLTLPSAMTKRIDATWAAGTTNGGLFSGSVANNTWYYYYLIKKDSDGSIDAGWDTSKTAANKPAGYTYYRRIACHRTDGSANIRGYAQYGSYFMYNDDVEDLNTSSPSLTWTSLTLTVPPVTVKANTSFYIAGALYRWLGAGPPNANDSHPGIVRCETTSNNGQAHGWIPTNTGQVKYKTNVTGLCVVGTMGWQDMFVD